MQVRQIHTHEVKSNAGFFQVDLVKRRNFWIPLAEVCENDAICTSRSSHFHGFFNGAVISCYCLLCKAIFKSCLQKDLKKRISDVLAPIKTELHSLRKELEDEENEAKSEVVAEEDEEVERTGDDSLIFVTGGIAVEPERMEMDKRSEGSSSGRQRNCSGGYNGVVHGGVAKKSDRVVGGGPLGGYFERGGAGGSGSGGGPGVVFGGSLGSKSGSGCLQVLGDICGGGCMLDGGKKCFTGGSGCGLSYLAGNWKFDVGTATCGGLKREGGVVLKCRFGSNGSSGGPGTFSDEKSTGDSDPLAGKNVGEEDGRHSWRGLLQKVPELEQQRRMSEVWVGLEKKPGLEGGSNGNLVITEKRESMGQPISKFSQPNLPVSHINPTTHRPTFLTPKILSPYFIKLIQHLIVTLNSFSDFPNPNTNNQISKSPCHTISSTLTLTSQPHGLPLPCDHLITTPTFFISPVPNFLSSSTASLTSSLHLFKPKTFKPQAHNTSSTPDHFRHSFLHHFQDFFFLVEALTRARELYEEEQQHELKHKLGLGPEGLQDTEYTSRGPEFSDDYDPP